MSLFIFLVVLATSCSTIEQEGETKVSRIISGDALASVYDRDLFIADIQSSTTFPQEEKDSLKLLKKVVNEWIVNQLFLHQAEERNVEDPEMDKLVQAYRESLVQHNYEKHLINTALDTVVTDFDLKAHYEANKEQYALEANILRCFFIKVKKPVRKINSIEEWLDYPSERNLQYLRKYCMDNARHYLINPEKWYKWEDIKNVFPKDVKDGKIYTGLKRSFSDFKYHYFVEILEHVSKQEKTPLSFFEERAKKLIIRQRKNRLLDDLKAALYEKEKASRHVKINIE